MLPSRQGQSGMNLLDSVAEAYTDNAGLNERQAASPVGQIKRKVRRPRPISRRTLPHALYAGAPACRFGSAFMNAGCWSHTAMIRSIVGASGIAILNTRVTATMLARQISAMVGSSP